MEIIGGEPRRKWSLDQKLAVVAATFQPGASVNGVARQLGVNPGMVFSWRKQYREQLGHPEPPEASAFTPVLLAAPETAAIEASPGIIEIDFRGGVQVRMFGDVRADLATAILGALAKR